MMKQFTSLRRAALLLLTTLLTATTAWAQTETVTYIDGSGNEYTCDNYTVIDEDNMPTTLTAGWYVVEGKVEYTSGIRFVGEANIILADGCNMTVNNSELEAININDDLTIYGQSLGTGKLIANGFDKGINAIGDITINGGIVTATGKYGIYAMGTITLGGGIVTATGKYGIQTLNGTITLGGGIVNASSYRDTVNLTCDYRNASGEPIYSSKLSDFADVTLYPDVAVSYLNEDGDTQTVESGDYIILEGNPDGGADLAAGTYVVKSDITYTGTITLDGDVTLILADGKAMNVSGAFYGIHSKSSTLTIYGQTLGTGTLNATATATNGIGIYTDGIVTINGGTVNATGTSDVGIRGIDGVTINGGTVTTTGIMADGDVTISGGKFTATDDPGISSNSGNVILGWTSADDFIKADSYYAHGTGKSVAIAPGYAFHNGSEVLSGTISESDYATKLEGMTLAPAVVLADAADNTTAIADHAGQTLAVALSGRTLYKDGAWNTLCLPFALGDDQAASGHELDGTPLEGATLMTLGNSPACNTGFDPQTGTLNLDFLPATTVEPGVAYIVKWPIPDGMTDEEFAAAYAANPDDYDLKNPVFTGVTVTNDNPAERATTSDDTYVSFVGTYGPAAIYAAPATALYLGAANKLYWPTATNFEVKSFRAYFQLNNGLTCGDPTNPNAARQFVLNFGDEETTGVVPIDNGQLTIDNSAAAWYDMQGRKLSAQPTKKGLYIHNGKKVAIK